MLEGQIAHLREREIQLIQDIVDALGELGDAAETDRKRLKDVATDLRDMFFMVAIIGEFNAGKSSFVNAILGEKLLPMGITPTTEHIELIRYGETVQRVPTVRQDGLREWTHPDTGAEGVAIVDTPGTGSVFQKHETTAKDFLHRSDMVIFLISAKHAFADTERMYLEMAKQYGKKIILVVNQIDLLQPNEQMEVRRFIEAQVKERLNIEPLLFMVSAKEAVQAIEAGKFSGAEGGIGAVKAHLRGVYAEAPPAKQKLLAQLDTTRQVTQKWADDLSQKQNLLNLDFAKVEEVKRELEQQSLGLETRMKESGANIRVILEGLRLRGMNFIDTHLNISRIGRGVNRKTLQEEFQEVVIGRSLRDINESTEDYINAVVDQSRLYWRGVIDRLNRLQDLLDQEVSGLDSGIYAEQRAGLQEAIRLAKAELESYSSGTIVSDMERMFSQNMSAFQGTALFTLGGVVLMLLSSVFTAGPLIGVGAAPLALPAFIAGGVVAAVAGVPTIQYYRKLSRETKTAFNERVDQLIKNYDNALNELTSRERSRLTQYGNQILTPVFSRLEVLAKRYQDEHARLQRLLSEIDDLKGRIDQL